MEYSILYVALWGEWWIIQKDDEGYWYVYVKDVGSKETAKEIVEALNHVS